MGCRTFPGKWLEKWQCGPCNINCYTVTINKSKIFQRGTKWSSSAACPFITKRKNFYIFSVIIRPFLITCILHTLWRPCCGVRCHMLHVILLGKLVALEAFEAHIDTDSVNGPFGPLWPLWCHLVKCWVFVLQRAGFGLQMRTLQCAPDPHFVAN